MRLRRALFALIVAVLLLGVVVARAQNTLVRGVDNTRQFPSLTSLDQVNRSGRQIVQPGGTYRLAWSQPSSALDYGYVVEARRNGGGALNEPLVATDCRRAAPMWDCVGNLPTAVVGAINAGDVVDLRVGPPGLLEFTALQVTGPSATTTCRYVAPDSTVGTRPVDTSIGGVMSGGGAGDKQRIAERIGMMRRDGWRVEWQWDQSRNEVVVMMWCVGIPQ